MVVFSAREEDCYQHWFQVADVDGTGRLGGAHAASFLSRSGLDHQVLKQIWDRADSAGTGALDRDAFFLALRLIAHVQGGSSISSSLKKKEPHSLPQFGQSQTLEGSTQQRGRSPTRGQDRPIPTPRDLRKFARLFLRLGGDKSQFIGGSRQGIDDVKTMMSRSGLATDQLERIWDLSDGDRDGQLSFLEFVIAMHLIRRARSGQPLPAGRPVELETALLHTLEPPAVLAAQHSRPPSGAASDAGTSAFDGSWSPPPSSGFPGQSLPGLSLQGLNDMSHGRPGSPTALSRRSDSPGRAKYIDETSPDFGERRPSNGLSLPLEESQPVEHLEAMIEADKVFAQHIRKDLDSLTAELKRLEEACYLEEREAAKEDAECERMGQEQRHLMQQLDAARRQFNEIKVEHQSMHLEAMSRRRDHEQSSREVAFLRRLLDESLRDSHTLTQSIEYLEQSNHSICAHTKTLEDVRRGLLDQVRAEKAVLGREQREVQIVKQASESLRAAAPGSFQHLKGSRPSGDTRRPSGSGAQRTEVVEQPWHAGLSLFGATNSGDAKLGSKSAAGGRGVPTSPSSRDGQLARNSRQNLRDREGV
eukprot:gnl/TRDRNA2_/TRDRNA2_36579_c0_seq1.p1 gnl/TRDRNA2_/TRDRNA2_36579_c0~~gnl/TRDRNA2_/TRDRNA2_36579_c0_seq1.p1  ORF type:complete len:589 (+),score=117.27 gnl/TRDRNA2_/TRDRNA2_36579_c0_seq1:48-1814(+)